MVELRMDSLLLLITGGGGGVGWHEFAATIVITRPNAMTISIIKLLSRIDVCNEKGKILV